MLNDYLEQFEPMQRGRIKRTLEKQQGFNGEVIERYRKAREIAKNARFDEAKGRLYFTNQNGIEVFWTVKDVTQIMIDYVLWLQVNP